MFKYGHTTLNPKLPEKCDILTVQSKSTGLSEAQVCQNALKNPVGAAPLSAQKLAGKSVCVIISDITRSWQRSHVYLPQVLAQLEQGGAQKQNTTILCALGTHRAHSQQEKIELCGADIYNNYKFVDHDCDAADLCYIGTTNAGTEVMVNKIAAEADFLVVCGGVVFHDMAGFGGGRKSIVPGVAGRKTISKNHSLSMNPHKAGIRATVAQNSMAENPINIDLNEAANMLKPDFLFNIAVDGDEIVAAFAGDFNAAFDVACNFMRNNYICKIDKLYDGVIVGAGGFPCDINFYQGSKAVCNAVFALKKGGSLVLLCESPEGLGSEDMEQLFDSAADYEDMEKQLRSNFTIGRFISFLSADLAQKYNIYIYGSKKFPLLEKHGIKCFDTFEQAMHAAGATEQKQWLAIADGSKILPQL